MTLDPHAARLLRMLSSAPKSDAAPPDPETRRKAFRNLAALTADPVDERVAVEAMVCPRDAPKPPVALRLYRPLASGDASGGMIVYLHGGGWVAGDLDTHDGVCRALAVESGYSLIAIDYRRPPEHRFPAAIDDAIDVLLWVRTNAQRWGIDAERLVLAGDSAGGNIAAAAIARLARDPCPVALLVLLCPILEISPNHPSRSLFAEGYFLDRSQMAQDVADYLSDPADAISPAASPLRIPDLAGFPPTHLHLAQYDPFRDEGLRFAGRLRAAGVAVQSHVHMGMIHNFYTLPKAIPQARAALVQIGAAIGGAR